MEKLNAKNTPFDQPGAGSQQAGITDQNAVHYLQKLRNDYLVKGIKDGGNEDVWNKLIKNTDASLARSRSPQALAMQEFIKTGKLPEVLPNNFDRFTNESLDVGVREADRAQQHKPTNFFTEYLMDPLVEFGLGAIPGIGPALAVGYGGIKGGVEDGFVGGLTGALSGYGAGNLGAGAFGAGSAAGGVEGFMNDPIGWAGNFGHEALNGVTNTLSGVGNFLEHPIQGIEQGLSSVGNFLEHPIDNTAQALGFGGNGAPTATGIPGYSNAMPLTQGGVPLAPGVGVGGGDLSGVSGVPSAGADAGAAIAPTANPAAAVSSATDVPVIAPSAAAGAKSLGGGVLNALGINRSNIAPLALQAYSAFRGPQASTGEKTIQRALDDANKTTQPFSDQSKQLLDFYNSGKLHPSDEQAIADQVRQEQARINDFWSRSGASDSTGRIQMLHEVDQKASALRDKVRQGYLISAIQSGQFGVQASTQLTQTLAQIQALGDREASSALDSFLQSIAQSNAYGRYSPAAPKP